MGSWFAVQVTTQEIFLVSFLSLSTSNHSLLNRSKILCFPLCCSLSPGHHHLSPGWFSLLLTGYRPLEATSLHLGICFCTVASEVFLNCKSNHVTPLLLTLQKLLIAPRKSLGMIQKAFCDLSFLIACSLGFPTSVSTFSRISALAGAKVRLDTKPNFANVL